MPLENTTSNDTPPLAKFTSNSFGQDGGGEGARPEPFSRALRGEMVGFVGSSEARAPRAGEPREEDGGLT